MRIKFRAANRLNFDYLHYLFKAKPGDKEIKITLTEDFGRMAVALYSPCEKRDMRPDDEFTVRLRLPRHKVIAGTTGRIHYTDAMQKRLNLILTAHFNIDLDTYYTQGIEAGMSKQEIIEAFIVSRGLVWVDNTELLTKRTYRNTVAAIQKKRMPSFDGRDIITRKSSRQHRKNRKKTYHNFVRIADKKMHIFSCIRMSISVLS